MACALSFIKQYSVSGQKFLECNVTGDETWVHYHTPEGKYASMGKETPMSPRSRKCKVVRSIGKVMAMVFWDHQGVLTYMMQQGPIINAVAYCTTYWISPVRFLLLQDKHGCTLLW
jgi:hypothetical protein